MFCPNYRNREVFDGFNLLIEAFGGRPMTEEEFKSAELRELRSGRDYSAMEAAYRVYHRNAGNFLDKAPNGEPSILFRTLLDYFDGDVKKAIVAKSNVYSDEFFNWFGDWALNKNSEPKVKFYGATMGKTTASKTNKNLVDFDDIVREPIKNLADKNGVSVRELKTLSGEEYKNLLLNTIEEWRNNPDNNGKTLVVSNAVLAKENIFDNTPSLPSKEEFVNRQVGRGEGDKKVAELYYDDLVSKWMPEGFSIDNRYVSGIESVSKVVDTNGEPLVVWHSTNREFDTFDKNAPKQSGEGIIGKQKYEAFFFSDSKEYSKQFATKISLPVYLNIKKPFSEKYSKDEWEATILKSLKRVPFPIGSISVSRLKEKPFGPIGENSLVDGVVGRDVGFEDETWHNEYAVYESNQIKHVKNLGTFDPQKDNIYHSEGDPEEFGNGMSYEDMLDLWEPYDGYFHEFNNLVFKTFKRILYKAVESRTKSLPKYLFKRQRYLIPVLLEIFPDGVTIYDAGDVIERMNSAFKKISAEYGDTYVNDPLISAIILFFSDERFGAGNLLKGMKIVFYWPQYPTNVRGSFWATRNMISIDIANAGSGEGLITVMLHEMIHALTTAEINIDDDLRNDINGIINYVNLNYPQYKYRYGLTNPYEFISEFFTNTGFLSDLKQIPPVDLTKFKSLFNQFVYLIISALRKAGFFVNESPINLYEQLLPAMTSILRNGALKGDLQWWNKHMLRRDLGGELLNSTIENGKLNVGNIFKKASVSQLFGSEFVSGQTVSSRDLISRLLELQTFSNSNMDLARLISRHDIPVKLEALPSGKLMACRTYEDGSVVILVNPNHSDRVSNRRLSDSLLHEVIHAITVLAINNPKTEEERKFAQRNRDMFRTFDKLFPAEIFSRNDMDTGYYILKNEKEFSAVFATDQNARSRIFAKAIAEDKKHNRGLLRLIKRFINAFARAIVNKNVFKDIKQDELLAYQKTVKKYLINKKSIVKGNISRAELFKDVYNNMDDAAVNGDGVSYAREAMLLQNYEENAAVDVLDQYRSTAAPADIYVTNEEQAAKYLKDIRKTVVEGLTKRLQAVRASTLPEDYKTQQEQIILSHIQMFKSETMSDFVALSNLISQILPTLKKDQERLLKIHDDDNYVISATDYMYHMHSNFGTYAKILDGIKNALRYDTILQYLQNQFEEDTNNQLSIRYTMDLLNRSVNDASATVNNGILVLNDLLIRTVYEDLRDIGIDTHSPDMVEYLQELRRIGYDTSGFTKTFGSADRAKDNGLRAIAYLTNKANREADSRTVSRAVSLLKLKDALKQGESELDLYELDDEGLTTGYMVRKVNFGLFLKDYNKEILRINEYINKKYNLALDPDNRLAPDDPAARKEWNDMRNKWLGDNAERKYKKEYYEAFSKLSEITRQRRNEIQRQIAALKTEALGNDGYYHYENLTAQQYKTLLGLYIQKRILVSDYDANGNLKQEGTPDYIVAKELQQLQQDLYGDKQVSTDREAWERALNEYKESIKDKSEEEQKKLLKTWHDRNSQRRLKIKDGIVLLWKRIDDETKVLPVYEYKGDNGKTYEDNNKEINKLLNLYRNRNTWNVDVTRMPDSVKDRIRELEKQNQKIARLAKKKNRKLRLIAKDRQKVFAKYAKWAATEEYKLLKKDIFKGVSDEMADETYDMFLASTGTFYGPDMEQYRRFRWFNKIEVLPEYQEEFTELVPGDGFINTEENDSLLNENYTRLSREVGIPGTEVEMSMIPKANVLNGRYDNSKAYNKIFGKNGSQTLQALYKGVYDTVKESNEKNYALRHSDAYQLPQITGSFFKRLKRQGNKWHAAWEYVLDEVGWDGRITPNDLDYGDRIDHVLDNLDEMGQITSSDSGTFNTKSVGTYGDGRRLNIVPLYYTRKLKDPSLISSDLIGITLEYFNSSLRYSHKNAIKDKCEAIVDMMRNREYYNEAASKKASKTAGEEVTRSKPGTESNTYQMASKFVQMNLYNIRDTNTYTIAGNEINFGKIAALFRAATVAINLGCNIAVAGTGFLTASYTHIIQAMTGQHYTLKDAINGGNTVMWHMLMNIGGAKYIDNKLSKDKLMITMEYFNIADQGKRKYKHVNRNHLVNAVNDNWCFGMLTGLDFIIKSNVATSTLYSFHYYNGEFTTKEDLLANMSSKSTKEIEDAIADWEEGVNLWSVIEPKDGAFDVKAEYKEAFDKVEHVVQSRIEKYAEAADGMATETQKAAITTGWVGSAILTHRQYLPLLLQDRLFGEMVWDMDMQLYQGGVFRTAALAALCLWDGVKAGSIAQGRETFNRYFNDNSTVASSLKSRARRYQLRLILIEYSVFKLVFSPLVSALCSYADEDDQKDDKLLQLLAYIMVRTRWEAFTPYRADDIFNNLKTVSALTGTMDKVDALGNDMIRWVLPQGDLYNTFLRPHIKNRKEYNPVVQKGIYEGWYKSYRDAFKFLPIHNMYEQINGSKQKRDYYTNLIEKLNG